MKNLVKGLVIAGALLGAGLAGIGAASAMPLAPPAGAPAASAPIETIGWRCGPGWHVNPWGRCVPNRRWGPGPYWRRPYWHRRWRRW